MFDLQGCRWKEFIEDLLTILDNINKHYIIERCMTGKCNCGMSKACRNAGILFRAINNDALSNIEQMIQSLE